MRTGLQRGGFGACTQVAFASIYLLGACIAWPCLVSAQAKPKPHPEMMGQDTTRGLAMGAGARAAASSTSALLYNVAGLSVGKVYHLDTELAYFAGERTLAAAVLVADSLTSVLAAGFSARTLRSLGTGGYAGLDLRLGLALPASDALSFGVVGRHLSLEQRTRDRAGNRVTLRLAKGMAFGAAVRLRVAEQVQIALLANDVVQTHGENVPTQFGLSAAADLLGAASLGVDLLRSSFAGRHSLIAGLGAEYRREELGFRSGYRYHGAWRQHALSGGLSYQKAPAALELALRRGFDGKKHTTLMLALRYLAR